MIDTTTPEFQELIKLCEHPMVKGKWNTEIGDIVYNKQIKIIAYIYNLSSDKFLTGEYIGLVSKKEIADCYQKNNNLVWIPLPIDPINPERGVWSWIDWGDDNLVWWSNEMDFYYGVLEIFLTQQGVDVEKYLKQ